MRWRTAEEIKIMIEGANRALYIYENAGDIVVVSRWRSTNQRMASFEKEKP